MPKGVYVRTEVHKRAISLARQTPEWHQRILALNATKKGVPLSEEHRRKIGMAGLGRKRTEEFKTLVGNIHRGKIRGQEERAKQSATARGKKKANTGDRNGNWNGGTTSERMKAYNSREYKDWRKAVFERDNYTCRALDCPKTTTRIQADHIKPFAIYPELRFDVTNGQTLCEPCHLLKTASDMKLIRGLKKQWTSS